jgi:hypothetical protein
MSGDREAPGEHGKWSEAERKESARSEAERVRDGTAWRDFCRALERAGDALLQPGTPDDPFERAEGLRYLTRLLRAGLESHVESSDPRYPRFYQLANETIKIGNDNPDNLYHNANLSGAHRYRIEGRRGTVPYLSFITYGGGYETDGSMRPTGQLDLDPSACEPDGSFAITLACERQPRLWLPMQPHTKTMVVRQTFQDRSQETPASYRITCLDPDAPDTLRVADIEPALQRAAAFVAGTANLFVDWMRRFETHTNALPPNDQALCQQAGGDANIHYHNSRWQLGPDEALLVEVTPPECTTWNLQLGNFWMESLDYRHHRIHVNKFTADYEADGSVRILIAHRDPGPRFPNWLDTCEHSQGAMLFRYVGASEYPAIATRVVRFADLANR